MVEWNNSLPHFHLDQPVSNVLASAYNLQHVLLLCSRSFGMLSLHEALECILKCLFLPSNPNNSIRSWIPCWGTCFTCGWTSDQGFQSSCLLSVQRAFCLGCPSAWMVRNLALVDMRLKIEIFPFKLHNLGGSFFFSFLSLHLGRWHLPPNDNRQLPASGRCCARALAGGDCGSLHLRWVRWQQSDAKIFHRFNSGYS